MHERGSVGAGVFQMVGAEHTVFGEVLSPQNGEATALRSRDHTEAAGGDGPQPWSAVVLALRAD